MIIDCDAEARQDGFALELIPAHVRSSAYLRSPAWPDACHFAIPPTHRRTPAVRPARPNCGRQCPRAALPSRAPSSVVGAPHAPRRGRQAASGASRARPKRPAGPSQCGGISRSDHGTPS
jgi:hypothetical protein